MINLFTELSTGLTNTLLIFFLTLIFSLPLGLVVLLGKKSKITPVRWLVNIYISIMRGTPLMLQLMFVYFGPFYIFGMPSPGRFKAVLVAFILNYSAYFAEIYRGGLDAIPKGQYEAAQVLGLNKFQTFIKIILPQVIKTVLPSITNEIMTLVKDTSLAMVISVSETFTVAKAMAAREASMAPYVAVAGFYYFMNYIVGFIMGKIENRLNYYK